MAVSFIGQPFEDFGWSADWFKTVLRDERVHTLEIAVAWVKRSGLARISEDLTAFRSRGGNTSIIAGIDEGGATVQGLTLALNLFDNAYVFHDRSSRTFHPKVYLAKGDGIAYLMVGSNNLTAGGFYNNYEGALVCVLDPENLQDMALLAQINSWFAVIYTDRSCKLLDQTLLEILISIGKYKVGDEDRTKREGVEEEDYDGITTDPQENIFGISSSKKKGLAPRLRDAREGYDMDDGDIRREHRRVQGDEGNRDDGDAAPTAIEIATSIVQPVVASIVLPLRWIKQLSPADAQHPIKEGSNPTGNLKLAKAGNDIDFKTFFRYEMFGTVNWASETRPRGLFEEAIVPFQVVINGRDLGRFNIKIDHAEHRIANQSNVPTWLHWGPLRDYLQVTNYTQSWVIIARRSYHSFVLEISGDAPNL